MSVQEGSRRSRSYSRGTSYSYHVYEDDDDYYRGGCRRSTVAGMAAGAITGAAAGAANARNSWRPQRDGALISVELTEVHPPRESRYSATGRNQVAELRSSLYCSRRRARLLCLTA